MRSPKILLMGLVAAVALTAAGPGEAATLRATVSGSGTGLRVAVTFSHSGDEAVSASTLVVFDEAFSLDRRDTAGSGQGSAGPAAFGGTGSSGSTAPGSFGTVAADPPAIAPDDTASIARSLTGEPSGPAAPGDEAAAPRTVSVNGGKALDVPRLNQFTGGGRYPKSYCGPTSVRMVLAFFGIRIGADAAAAGVYRRGKGASHDGMARKLRQYGVRATLSHTRSLASLKAAIGRGHPVIINVRGNYGPRRTGGHIIVVVGFDGSGNPIINDPAGGGRHVCPKRKFLNAWNGLMIEASK